MLVSLKFETETTKLKLKYVRETFRCVYLNFRLDEGVVIMEKTLAKQYFILTESSILKMI